jgi:cytoskeletal protein RodZ
VHEVAARAGGALSTFGGWLERSRKLRGLELTDVAALTKLPPRIVQALEKDDFAALQDRAYALLVARACAAAIGLDPEDTALRLEEQLGPAAQKSPRSLAKARQPLVWLVLLITAIACALLLMRK